MTTAKCFQKIGRCPGDEAECSTAAVETCTIMHGGRSTAKRVLDESSLLHRKQWRHVPIIVCTINARGYFDGKFGAVAR